MKKNIKKIITLIAFFVFYSLNSFADNSYFIDFTKVLNSSKPGAEAQEKLKSKFTSETNKFKKIEEDIRKQESELISQKKAISSEEYKKKVETLRKKVADLQKNKQSSFNNIAKSRSDAKAKLLKVLNPILKKYMEDNKISLILNKNSVILGDTTLEITNEIIAILNKELPSLKIN
jgi:outer membrane protein